MARCRNAAHWSPGAYQLLHDMWRDGLEPEVIASRLRRRLGKLVSPAVIKVTANKKGFHRSPAAVSEVRRQARAGKGFYVNYAREREERHIAGKIKRAETMAKKKRDPARLMKLILPPPVVELGPKPSPQPYRGLATLGPDPFRAQRLAQAIEGSRGRLG